MNDANLQACSRRTGHGNGFLPSSCQAIFRGASTFASTIRSAGYSIASTISSTDEDLQCEQVQWAGFDKLELVPHIIRQVLLLSYANGFQVWDVENADEVKEIVSKRDGPVFFLRVQPQPAEKCDEKLAHPLLLVVTSDASKFLSKGYTNGYNAALASSSVAENPNAPSLVKFYSLQSYSYVHTLSFRAAILAVRCSPRVVAIGLATQLYCFNAATLQSTFSVPTYPSPQLGSNRLSFGHGALAVGARWLAYAANQPINSNAGRVSPQNLTAPGVSPSTSPTTGSLVARYAKESTKHLAAGIAILGDKGYKALSRYYTENICSPVLGSPIVNGSCGHTEHAGMVIVHDFVTKLVVSQFRAHDSPLSALSFDHTGTLLVSASIHGHSINIFRILPVPNGNGVNTSSYDTNSSHIHLYTLYRGMTTAVIQDIAFSEDSHWIVVSSSRGTHHLFAISPFGGAVGPSTHGASFVGHPVGSMQLLPWWCNRGPLVSSQYVSGTSPATVSLSVASRIRPGNGGRIGTVASSRFGSLFGAVAVMFHDGRSHKLGFEGGQNTLKEQLWVFSPSGHLIRHALILSAGTGSHSNIISSPMVAGLQQEDLDLKVVVKPLQEWDLCRRLNWMERDEKVNVPNIPHDRAGNSTHLTTAKAGLSQNEATLGNPNTTLTETTTNTQVHQWFLSNAEVHTFHLRPPVWAIPQVSFHVLSKPASNKILREDAYGGEYEIERVVSRVVEVRKQGLVPVFRNYQPGEDIRDASCLPRDRLTPLTFQSGIESGLQRDVGVVQSQYSTSGSSCGSEASLCRGLSAVCSNDHHSYEDCPLELQYQPMNTVLAHESHQHIHPEISKLKNPSSPSFNAFKSEKGVSAESICFPSGMTPYQSHENTCIVELTAGEKLRLDCSDVLHKGERVSVPSHGKAVATTEPIKTACFPNGCYCKHKGLVCLNSAGTRSDSRYMLSAGDEMHPTLRSHGEKLDKTSESLGNFTNKNLKEKFDRQGDDEAMDSESSDVSNKSEDFGGEEKGEECLEGEHAAEDGWEGALFPFVEDE